ncbi:kinase-like domain-containing protein [Globomyces pollinis-pini]|nr:kinase-like domain-containing protein [Globomyces pollinis-pini]KAJ3000064.1 Mitogen-activated protein kinase [Globomyces sp. JEL0801]
MSYHPKILEKYKVRREIGRGAYGVVSSAKEIKTDRGVAIKLVGSRNFEETILTKRALRELKILRHLNGHENIALFLDCDTNETGPNFTELYLVEGLMEADLNQILKSGQQLTSQHYQYFLYQMLRGLKWMHSANILHRDLKPGNLLVNSDCELRICDFGLARGETADNGPLTNTEYVATRYYRAPEVVLSPKHYSKAIDLWSVGCIFGEMLTGHILFRGNDYIDQLSKIFEVLGTPQDPTLTQLCSARVLKYLRTWPKRQKANFAKLFPNADNLGLDLIDKLLAFDPQHRINASDALCHAYLSMYHVPDDEPSHPKSFDFSFEATNTIPEIKKLIAKEVALFKEQAAGMVTKKPEVPATSAVRQTAFSGPEIDEEKVKDLPRFVDEVAPAGPCSIEEELQMRDLKIE